ncbi:MAG: J domain-containing protein [Candidatus Coatesbacteria bacterium]|nr:J domain-containing protein [Candidatus Coatesbacteria bacterium]
MEKNFYEVLGVKPDVNEKDLKRIYRDLAKTCHPDRCKGNKEMEERFKLISEAYSVLSDKEQRKHYDEYLKMRRMGFNGGFQEYKTYLEQGGRPFNGNESNAYFGGGNPFYGANNFRSSQGQGSVFNIEDILGGDIFSSLLGGKGQKRQKRNQMVFRMDIPFLIAAKGGDINFNLPEPFNQEVKLKVPAGILDGTKIRLKNKGLEQVQIEFYSTPHPIFIRDGYDIRSSVYIDLFTALLGGKQNVQTIWGSANLNIPEGTEPGTVLRLKGMGVKPVNRQAGDHLAEINVRFPKNLTEKQKEILRSIQQGG